MDGENYQRSFRSMEKKFELFQQNMNNVISKRSGVPVIYKPVYLHFGIFYDGAQLFDRNNESLWALIITILNFPPQIRHKIGILFVIYILNG